VTNIFSKNSAVSLPSTSYIQKCTAVCRHWE